LCFADNYIRLGEDRTAVASDEGRRSSLHNRAVSVRRSIVIEIVGMCMSGGRGVIQWVVLVVTVAIGQRVVVIIIVIIRNVEW